jgi:hypothetical protein
MRTCSQMIVVPVIAVVTGGIVGDAAVSAQIQAVNPQIRHAKGQPVSPVYEGWYRTSDGAIFVSFGYFNRNTEEVVRIPVGAENKLDPQPADQGQPTVFFPGRHFGVFAVAVPKDRPKTEMTWTLSNKGQALTIPANLDPLFLIDPLKEVGGAYPGNTPPTLRLDQGGPALQGPRGGVVTKTATAGTPLTLDVWLTDDGLPPAVPPGGRGGAATTQAQRGQSPVANVPGGRGTPGVPPRGLSATWSAFRGPGTVTFADETPELQQGKASTTATFSEPGEYLLRVLAADGSGFSAQCCWTNGYVRVTVGPGASR